MSIFVSSPSRPEQLILARIAGVPAPSAALASKPRVATLEHALA